MFEEFYGLCCNVKVVVFSPRQEQTAGQNTMK